MENEIMSAKYSRAMKLNQHIKIHAELAQQSLYEMCKGLKEMRDDKLYRELEYQNFEEYCEKELGLSRFMAYKYANIAEIENVESIQHLGVTKLALLAKLDEPTREEIVQNVDLENTSVKQLKEEIASLKADNEQKDKANEELRQQNDKLFSDRERLTDSLAEAKRKNGELEDTIEELENRPVDVEYSDNTEEIRELKMQIRLSESKIEDIKIEHEEEIENIKAGYEKKMSTLRENHENVSEIDEAEKSIIILEKFLAGLYEDVRRQYGDNRESQAKRLDDFLFDWSERFEDLWRFDDDDEPTKKANSQS